ncbi:MAG: response regulator transcription factor [Chitinophagaceae bacterium]|nr:response regulator transcription factor [Chitinophagaceae bacterium]
MLVKRKMKVAIVDDHQIVIDGIVALLENHPEIEVSLASTSAFYLLDCMNRIKPDILLTDIFMPEMDGRSLSKKISEEYPQTKIIVLSMQGSPEWVNQLIDESNIAGYVIKNISRQELIKAIEIVYNGGIYFSHDISEALKQWKQSYRQQGEDHLTRRETEIIRLIEKEMSTKEIAAALHISERTVETHRKNIFRKTQTHSVLGLIKYAYQHQLIS